MTTAPNGATGAPEISVVVDFSSARYLFLFMPAVQFFPDPGRWSWMRWCGYRAADALLRSVLVAVVFANLPRIMTLGVVNPSSRAGSLPPHPIQEVLRPPTRPFVNHLQTVNLLVHTGLCFVSARSTVTVNLTLWWLRPASFLRSRL